MTEYVLHQYCIGIASGEYRILIAPIYTMYISRDFEFYKKEGHRSVPLINQPILADV